jgi:hypothetical protein
MKKELSLRDIDRIIEMGWEDRTPLMRLACSLDLKSKRSLPSCETT